MLRRMDIADVLSEARQAEKRIREFVRETPVERSAWLSTPDQDVSLKFECFQRTGSFKLRGALSRLTALTPEERTRGVVAASTGNHGMAIACGAAELGLEAVVFAPESADEEKLAGVRARGATVRSAGTDCVEAEVAARAFARETDRVYVSPYNDPLVLAGQGTVGLELARQLPDLDRVYVACGGGGLMSGIGSVLRGLGSEVELVGCSPARSAVLAHSVAAGRILDEPSLPTLSDGTAGGLEPEAITFDLCRRLVDRWVEVEEGEIAAAMRGVLAQEHALIEGAAGVAVAALLRDRERARGGARSACVVLCGANAAPRTLRAVLAADLEAPALA